MVNLENARAEAQAIRDIAETLPGYIATMHCAGGCGKRIRVSAGKVRVGELFICNNKATRDKCLSAFPVVDAGKVRTVDYQQAGEFSGVVYRRVPSPVLFAARAAEVARKLSRAIGR